MLTSQNAPARHSDPSASRPAASNAEAKEPREEQRKGAAKEAEESEKTL
jgi:hypothetical protein